MRDCPACAADLAFLQKSERPNPATGGPSVRVVDLFAGGGGLSLGVAEATRRLDIGCQFVLTIEKDTDAADIYELNFPSAVVRRDDICDVFDGDVLAKVTMAERRIRGEVGLVDFLVAGPPCQGHSDLNNHTRRSDPRNALYLRAVRAVEILEPRFVILENVAAIEHDEGDVVGQATKILDHLGYLVATEVLDLVRLGVPQMRRRHILVASRNRNVDLMSVLAAPGPCDEHHPRTVRWAIGDLVGVTDTTGPDSPSTPNAINASRMQWLIDNDEYNLPNERRPQCHHGDHSYRSMYGRLWWDKPAQTITTGFGSMGQGRYVHPELPRTITAHEAARLQTFPDYFELDSSKKRGTWAQIIGNAVPPLLVTHLAAPLLHSLALADVQTAAAVRGSPSQKTSPDNTKQRPGVPAASSEVIRRRMSKTKRRDTRPEMALRSELRRLGLRYFVDRSVDGSRRRADVVFLGARVAVFIDGCFWHGCPDHGTIPKENRDWWLAKLAANKERDEDTDRRLCSEGWVVLRIWEHDDLVAAAREVERIVRARVPRAVSRNNGSGQ